MNPLQGLLHLLSDPNIAFILFTIGVYGLIFELQNPNFVTGILGAIAIILAFIGFGSLPLNLAGLLLIVLGVVLFVLEATVTSHGLLAIGGIICFALGASALYTNTGDPTEPIVGVALPLIVDDHGHDGDPDGPDHAGGDPHAAHGAAGVHGRRAGARWAPRASSRRPLEPLGTAYLAGEAWSARTADTRTLPRDTPVRLVGFDGLTAIVEPIGRGRRRHP